MKILVTGAAGFIGTNLALRLKSLGHDVIGIDAFTDYYNVKLKELNADDLKAQGVKVHRLDLAEDDISKYLEDIEVVYHLAAQPGISQKPTFEDYVKNNIFATHKTLEAVKKQQTLKLFINIATSSIYGANADDTEDTAPKPTSYYGVTKLAAEQLVLAYNRDQGVPACSFRLFSVYGPRERPEKVYPKYIRAILEDNYVFPYREESEKHLRSYTFVGDIVDGLVLALDNIEKINGEIINLGIDTATTTGQALETLEKVAQKKAKVKSVPKMPGDQLKTEANITKAKKLLNYNPSTQIEDGLRQEYEWFKDNVIGKIDFGNVGN